MIDEELNQLLPQSRETFIRLSADLLSAIDALDVLKQGESESGNATLVAQIDNALSKAFIDARQQQTLVDAVCQLAVRLLRQQQSAKQAFETGWDARLVDILAHLSNEDCAALRHVLETLDENSLF